MFRDGRQTVSGATLISALKAALGRCSRAPESCAEDSVLAALIAAGELECALLDDPGNDTSASCDIASEITETLAHALLTGQSCSLDPVVDRVGQLRVQIEYQAAVQEGFAYYALHPRKVAMLLETLTLKPQVSVLGIRSIGVTLSAVACAALRMRGIHCRRITVRPAGHPYDRKLEVTAQLREWVEGSGDADFLVVDEGPGISGSSFLAVAEALTSCGVEPGRIHLIGSREVDSATLRAVNARERWAHFHFHVMQSPPLAPACAGESLSGGAWRRHFPCEASAMPASWASLEPAKFLSRDEQSIFRFEGFGHYGEAAGNRAALLAERGFAPRYLGNRFGFGEYALLSGRTLALADRSPELLERMASYLALRATAFATDTRQTPELETMLRWNWKVEFGEELGRAESRLRMERVVVCDGRMMPHKWLRTNRGELLKLDACTHGDNHFFPGACDIAWDVAGAIVEWKLDGEMRKRFIGEYEAQSGDAVRARLAPYLLAYTTFCLGWSRMAAAAMQGEYDEALLMRDAEKYRAEALRLRPKQTEQKTPEKSVNTSLRIA